MENIQGSNQVCPNDDAIHDDVFLYVDGELEFDKQPALFSHLADCENCRHQLESTLNFRQMMRKEVLTVPPAADDLFFTKLAALKVQNEQVDREADRNPMWLLNQQISLRAAVAAMILFFSFGFFLSTDRHFASQASDLWPVNAERATMENVVFEQQQVRTRTQIMPIYTFYPGLVVEDESLVNSEDLNGGITY